MGSCRTLVLLVAALMFAGQAEAQTAWSTLGPYGGAATALVVDPRAPDRIMVGTTGNGALVSEDAGATWDWTAGPAANYVRVLVAHPTLADSFYAATDFGLYLTSDVGGLWVEIDTGLVDSDKSLSALAVHPTNASILYVASSVTNLATGPQVLKSVDSGATWTASSLGTMEAAVKTVAIDRTTPTTVWAGTGCCSGGAFKSTNSGTSWTAKNTGLTTLLIDQILVHPTSSSTVFAATAQGLFRSTDGGENWAAAGGGLPANRLTALAAGGGATPELWAAIDTALYKSSDSGATWTAAGSLTGAKSVVALAVDPTRPARVFSGTRGSGIYSTTNGGTSWAAANNGFDSTWVRAVAVFPGVPGTLWAGTEESGAMKSTDRGVSWTSVALPSPVERFAAAPSATTTFYAVAGNLLHKTTNAGTSWVAKTTGLPAAGVDEVAVSASTPSTLYACRCFDNVYKSTDSAENWAVSGTGMAGTCCASILVSPTSANTVLVAAASLYYSTDGGGTWQTASGLTGRPRRLVVDPAGTPRYYVGTVNDTSAVYTSTNGSSWTACPTLVGDVTAMAVNSSNGALYVVADGVVSKSSDQCATWSDVTGDLPNWNIESLAIGIAPDELYAGTFASGVFAMDPAPAMPSLVTVSGNGQSATVGSVLPAPLVVRVQDASSNPIAGVTVIFAVTSGGGSVAPLSVVTGVDGQASATATLGTIAGSNTFTASATGVTGSPRTFTATGLAGAAAAMFKVSGDPQSGTAGTALPQPFVVRIEDAFGNPVAGRTVSFAVSSGGGTISPSSVVSAANGQASATGTLGPTLGTNIYTASSAGLTGSPQNFTATGTAGVATTLVKVSGDGQSGSAGGALPAAFVVRVEDAAGNPVSGRTITFSVTGGGGSIAPTSVVTTASGLASATGTLGTTAGTNTYRAASSGLTGSPATFTATGTAGAATTLVRISGNTQTGTAGSALPLPFVVRVNDSNGNPVSGRTITFAVASGGGSISPTSVVTGTDGRASSTATLGATAGANTFTATSAGLTNSPMSFTATGVAGAAVTLVRVSGDGQTAAAGTILPAPFVVRVEDANGNPVSGRTITFAVTSGGGSITPTSAVTASDGRASATATLGATAGTKTYSATSAGLSGSPATFTATATAGTPGSLVRVSGDGQSGTAGSALAAPFVVRVQDAGGNPVSGVAVNFTVTSGGGSITPATATTNASGQASATATLGATAGANSFTVTSVGLSGSPMVFTATGTAGAAATLIRVSGDGQTATVGTALSAPFVVRVEDANGNPVSGRAITFAVASGGGSISPLNATTNASGQASATGTLGTTAGGNTYTASSAGLTSVTFSATGNAGVAVRLVMVSGDAQSGSAGTALSAPFVVRAEDVHGNPKENTSITFSMASGGGSVSPAGALTAANGEASSTATLGPTAGTQTFTAISAGLTGSPMTFSATATPTGGGSIVLVSGDGQSGVVGSSLAAPFVIRVEDTLGNPLSNRTVTFTADTGGGSITPASVVTGIDGLATAVATLGNAAGANTYTAASAGMIGSPMNLSAIATAGPAAALVKVSGDNQIEPAGSTLSLPLVVKAQDAFGNAVAGVNVSFLAETGGGSITPTNATTGPNGEAVAVATLGPTEGANTYSASTPGLTGSPQFFTAQGSSEAIDAGTGGRVDAGQRSDGGFYPPPGVMGGCSCSGVQPALGSIWLFLLALGVFGRVRSRA